MSIFASYQPAPIWAEFAQIDVTAGIDTLYQDVLLLDLLTLKGRDAYQDHSHRRDGGGAGGQSNETNPMEHQNGDFTYRIGMTDLRLVLQNTRTVGLAERVRIIAHTNTSVVTLLDAALTNGLQTLTATNLAAQGWADGQVIDITVELYENSYPISMNAGVPWGSYYVLDLSVAPLSSIPIPAWGGLPTFTTGLDEPKLTQFSNALTWVANRVGLMPINLFQSFVRLPSLWFLDDNGNPIVQPMWSGGIVRGPCDRLQAEARFHVLASQAETYRFKINETTVQTAGPFSAGQGGLITFDINLSGYGATDHLRLAIDSTTTVPPAEGVQGRPSRLDLYRVQTYRSTPGAATLPTLTTPEESMSWPTLRARLNSLSSILGTIKARIDANPDLFDRARLYRWNYGYDAGERTFLAMRYRPLMLNRTGERLVVRGKNVKLGYGPLTTTPPAKEEPDGETSYANAYEQTLISGDVVQTVEVWLGRFAGLEVGTAYTLYGTDIRYAAEFLF